MPDITITNQRALRFFGFRPVSASAKVTQPATLWLWCLWRRLPEALRDWLELMGLIIGFGVSVMLATFLLFAAAGVAVYLYK